MRRENETFMNFLYKLKHPKTIMNYIETNVAYAKSLLSLSAARWCLAQIGQILRQSTQKICLIFTQ